MKKQIKNHEQEYIHIPKANMKVVVSFFFGLIMLALSYLNLKLIIYKWKELGLDLLFSCEENCNQFSNWIQLDICFNLILELAFVLFAIIGLFYLWNKLNYKKLIHGLIFGLIGGLIGGLIIFLIRSLIGGLIHGLSYGLILGLIHGLIFGLILGLIDGLIGGLNE